MLIKELDLYNFKPGQYCFNCQSPKIKEQINFRNQIFYFCPVCKTENSRVIEIDSKVRLKKTKKSWKHFTAGALIVDNFYKPKKFLIIKKRKHPYLYDVVAGHMHINENPEQTLAREVREEIKAEIAQKKLLLNITINPDPCRRGIDIHEWFLFLCTLKNKQVCSQVFLDEVVNARWYDKQELQRLALVIPAKKMFKLLKLI